MSLLRPDLADHPGDVAHELGCHRHLTVAVSLEEPRLGKTEELGRRPLLGLSRCDNRLALHAAVPARVARGHDKEGNFGPIERPLVERSGGVHVDVVWVRADDKHP